jgi:hypothetical protein
MPTTTWGEGDPGGLHLEALDGCCPSSLPIASAKASFYGQRNPTTLADLFRASAEPLERGSSHELLRGQLKLGGVSLCDPIDTAAQARAKRLTTLINTAMVPAAGALLPSSQAGACGELRAKLEMAGKLRAAVTARAHQDGP